MCCRQKQLYKQKFPKQFAKKVKFCDVFGHTTQSRPQSEFVALPLLWDTRGHSAI